MKHYINANCKISYYVKQVLTANSCRGYLRIAAGISKTTYRVLRSKFTTFTAKFIKFLLIL